MGWCHHPIVTYNEQAHTHNRQKRSPLTHQGSTAAAWAPSAVDRVVGVGHRTCAGCAAAGAEAEILSDCLPRNSAS